MLISLNLQLIRPPYCQVHCTHGEWQNISEKNITYLKYLSAGFQLLDTGQNSRVECYAYKEEVKSGLVQQNCEKVTFPNVSLAVIINIILVMTANHAFHLLIFFIS